MLFALLGCALAGLGTYGLIVHVHLMRKIFALNIAGSGIFLILVAPAKRALELPDAVPHAMVITGIVVAVSATALALSLMLRLAASTGRAELPGQTPND